MASVRQNKISRLIQKEMGNIFLRESSEHFPGLMVTVTGVRMSPDMSVAKIFISIFGTENKNEVIEKIKSKTGRLRYELSGRIRRQVRSMPELLFYLDDSLDYAENIERLLAKR
ncbi:MAG: 30S ribosome-binding factor RbfA [Bacteroidetes bacterium]|nr:30S ribosome-binding factor RbfA [Bacteroidota bacterium]